MKHLVTIMVDGQPMTASIRIGSDMTEDSDATGEVTEAIDVEGAPYTYTETETPIETPEMTTEERLQDAETALGIIFGEAE